MNKRWICSDVWMNILPSFDHAQLGLKMALLSDRFDFLVDAHFDGKMTEFTIWKAIAIRKDKGQNANDNGSKPKMCVPVDGNFVKFPLIPIEGKLVEFPLPDHSLPKKIRFRFLHIDYIDDSVIEFLRSNKQIWDRSGTNLKMWPYKTENDQSIWDVLDRQIWPIFASNVRLLSFPCGDYLDNLRSRTSPTILNDLDQLNSIDSGRLLRDGIADDGPNATAGQALTKWLHTQSKDGQPKELYRNSYSGPLNLEWVNDFKETFLRATTSVSYTIQLYFCVDTMPTEPFELVNERTNEKLILKQKTASFNEIMYNWLLQRCPIGETATVPEVKWEDCEKPSANLNNITFDLWSFNKSIGDAFLLGSLVLDILLTICCCSVCCIPCYICCYVYVSNQRERRFMRQMSSPTRRGFHGQMP